MIEILKNNKIYLTFVIILLTLDNVLSIITKYTINGLHVTSFNLSLFGNVFSLILFILAVTGVITKTITNGEGKSIKVYCILLALLALILNLAALVIIKWKLFVLGDYFLGFPANKFTASLLIITRAFVQIYFIAFVWMSVFRKGNWNLLRAVVVSFLGILLLGLFSFLYIQKDTELPSSYSKGNRTAVVLGAAVYKNNLPSPLFEARIKKAYELYRDSIVNKILVTGSNAPGEITEAEAAFEYLTRLNVDRKNIEIEDQSRTTIEQMRYIKQTYLKNNIGTDLIIISDQFHLTRTAEICKFLGIDFTIAASDYAVGEEKLLFYKTRESISLLIFWLFGI